MTLADFLCDWCCGAGTEPEEENGEIPCMLCGGSGYATLWGDLGPTHSEKRRPFSYNPACRSLTLGAGRKQQVYTVEEFTPGSDFEGRAFNVVKASGEVYAVLIGDAVTSCDCAGRSYEASEKANVRAVKEDRIAYPTLGCRHADAIAKLLPLGWLDLPVAEGVLS